MIPIFEQEQFKTERDKILRDMINYHRAASNDFRRIAASFLDDLGGAIESIQVDPCLCPDFPAPVKKKLFSKGTSQCVLLYMPVPTDHKNNNDLVEKVHLTSIMLTLSGKYNEYVMGNFSDCDFDG